MSTPGNQKHTRNRALRPPSDFHPRHRRQNMSRKRSIRAFTPASPPEPNGYLHIGHAKSILPEFSASPREFGGICNLRMDGHQPHEGRRRICGIPSPRGRELAHQRAGADDRLGFQALGKKTPDAVTSAGKPDFYLGHVVPKKRAPARSSKPFYASDYF
jgi:hypothetical protein